VVNLIERENFGELRLDLACMGKITNAFYSRNLKERDNLEDLNLDGKITMK
jgi:hypothetical protein